MAHTLRTLLRCAAVLPVACSSPPQVTFWNHLHALCDRAYAGVMVEGAPADSAFRQNELVMHVRQCSDATVRIPLHVGEDRSRTWVISRTTSGLRLTHDHRHRDGSLDDFTEYGGGTTQEGTAFRQEFHADDRTAQLLAAAATNVWTIEIDPGAKFVYGLRRDGTNRRVRLEFDLTHPVTAPPAPWGQ